MRFTLIRKFILFFSVFVFFLIVPLAFYFYIEIKSIIENQADDYLTAIAEAMEGQIFLAFDRTKLRATDWASDGFIREKAEKIIKTKNSEEVKALNYHFLNKKLPLNHSIKLIDVVDFDGLIIASSEEKRVGLIDNKHAPLGILSKVKSAKSGEVFLTGLEEETPEEGGEMFHPSGLMYHLIVPLKSLESDETVGILVLHFVGDIFNQILAGTWQIAQGAQTGQEFTTRLKTAEVYLVNEEKLMITPSRFVEKSILKQKVDTVPVRDCLERNQEFTGKYQNYLGEQVLGASMCFATFDGNKMALVVEVAESELFSSLAKERADFIFLALFLWILGILVGILLGNFLLKGIKSIYGAADRAIRGDLNFRAIVQSKDEIGELAAIFNKMMRTLKKRSNYVQLLRDVAVAANEAKTVKEVFQIVIDKICFYKNWPVGHAYIISPEAPDILISSDIWYLADSGKFKTFKEVTEKTIFTKGKGLSGRIWESGEPAWISNVTKDPNFPRAQMAVEIGVKSGFGFPVFLDDKIVAVLEFFTEEEEEEEEEFLAVVKNIGFQIGKVLERINAENQLRIRLEDLEKFRKVTIGRELRMAELKKEIEDLKNK